MFTGIYRCCSSIYNIFIKYITDVWFFFSLISLSCTFSGVWFYFSLKHLCFAYIPSSVFPQNCFPLVKLIVDLSIYIRVLVHHIAPFTAFDFVSPLSTVSMFVSIEQKIECSPLLVTNVKKEITSLCFILFLTNFPILYVFRCLILFLTKRLCFVYIPSSVFPQLFSVGEVNCPFIDIRFRLYSHQ
jgi:hypothetical protein